MCVISRRRIFGSQTQSDNFMSFRVKPTKPSFTELPLISYILICDNFEVFLSPNNTTPITSLLPSQIFN